VRSTDYETSHCVVFSIPLWDPNIILRTLFSNIVRLFPSFNFRDQVSHPCKTSTNHCIKQCYIIVTVSSVVKQTTCLVLTQNFLLRVFVQCDTLNFSDAVGKASVGTAQYRCTLSCHLNHPAFLSRLWRYSLQFRRCASTPAISAIISYTVRIAFEIPHSQIMHKIATRRDVKTNEVTPVRIVDGGVMGGCGGQEHWKP